jgi:putative heme-binding domain-containing protein
MMVRFLIPALFIASLLIGFDNLSIQDEDRFDVPDGFAVEEVYSSERAGSVVAITFDSEGRLVLSREDSTIVTLVDENGDGEYEEIEFTAEIHNSQGIFFDGPDLLAVGTGPDSVAMYRVVDEDGDSSGERIELIERSIGTMGDHGPHQPFFGPDGFLYWTLGNMSATYSTPAPLSPLRDYKEGVLALLRTDPRGHADQYRSPGGTFVRKNLAEPDSDWELVVGGFRNQYDGAFNMMGELFTFDSDMEWDRDLPWFRETRSVHAVPGGDFGWRTGSRKLLDYHFDTLPPMEDLGRGSPTGVTFYQSYAYPSEYWDAFIQSDWSRGRIVVGRLTRDGATYAHDEGENFVYGEPLNVTDVATGPDGYVYFSLGGRDTEGGIYRVVYHGPHRPAAPEATSALDRALTLAQPRSAWSRAEAARIRDEMGDHAWNEALRDEATNTESPVDRRVRALELLQVVGSGLDEGLLVSLIDDAAWEVRAASTYYLGLHATDSARRELAGRFKDSDPFVQRRAAEALVRSGIHPALEVPFSAVDDVFPLLASEDRFVRYAARDVLRKLNRNTWREAALELDEYPQATEALLAYVQTVQAPSVKDVTFLIERQAELLEAYPSDSDLLDLLRVIQLTMLEDQGLEFLRSRRPGDEGPGPYPQMAELLLERFPTGDWRLNREIARTLVHLGSSDAVARIAPELHDPKNDRKQQIFYAYALSNMLSGWNDALREQMISWFEKVRDEQWKGGASFVGYLTYMLDDFAARQPQDIKDMVEKRVPELVLQAAEDEEDGQRFRGPEYEAWVSAEEIEEWLIYSPDSFNGDPSDGAEAYEKAFCATCHTFGPLGQEFGPDLTTVGQRFSRRDLVEAVIRPSETISDLWTVEDITKTNGEHVTGTIYREDATELIVQIPGGRQVAIPTSEIASSEPSSVSAMPEGLLNNLTHDEMRDLFLFLEAGPEAIPDSLLEATN